MERWLNTVVRSVHGAGMVVAVLLLSVAVNRALDLEPWPSPFIGSPAQPVPRTSPPRLDPARIGRLLGLSVADDGPPPVSLPAVEGLRLLGTLLSPPHSLAALLDEREGRVRTCGVGDELRGAQVVDIERTRITVERDGARTTIDAAPGGRAEDRGVPVRNGIVREISSTERELQRTEVDAALAHLETLASDVRVVPAFRDGAAIGFKVFAIRPGSMVAQLGLSSGDVIRRINGIDLTSVKAALEAYNRLQSTVGRLELEVERQGAPLALHYTITQH